MESEAERRRAYRCDRRHHAALAFAGDHRSRLSCGRENRTTEQQSVELFLSNCFEARESAHANRRGRRLSQELYVEGLAHTTASSFTWSMSRRVDTFHAECAGVLRSRRGKSMKRYIVRHTFPLTEENSSEGRRLASRIVVWTIVRPDDRCVGKGKSGRKENDDRCRKGRVWESPCETCR